MRNNKIKKGIIVIRNKKKLTLITRSLLCGFLNSSTGSFLATEAHNSPIAILSGEDEAEQQLKQQQLQQQEQPTINLTNA